jgi:hypothetical protein
MAFPYKNLKISAGARRPPGFARRAHMVKSEHPSLQFYFTHEHEA